MANFDCSIGRTADIGVMAVSVSPATAHEFERNLDCELTLVALKDAIEALERGDGKFATVACAEAFARLAFFVRV